MLPHVAYSIVTACDLEKSLSIDKTVKTTSHVRFAIHA